jgi:hypothetical protein
MILTEEMYEYIRLDNTVKVEEYLVQENEKPVTSEQLKKVQMLLMYAIDWKRLELIKLFIKYSANPDIYNRYAMYYATTRTNGLPTVSIIDYLREGSTENNEECTVQAD